MPFGLKNAGAIYQRLVNKMFSEFLEKSIKAYVDDMLVKLLCVATHIQHLQQAFKFFDSYQMKFNPKNVYLGSCYGIPWILGHSKIDKGSTRLEQGNP